MKHFKCPCNVGEMKNYDGCGKVGNPICGDVFWLYLKIGKNSLPRQRRSKGKEIIKQASFSTFGCVVAIANGSLITTMIKGKTLEQALKISKEDLLKKLGRVPPLKIHCSLLAIDALAEAIYDYLSKNKKPIPKSLQKRHEKINKSNNRIIRRS